MHIADDNKLYKIKNILIEQAKTQITKPSVLRSIYLNEQN